MIENVYRLQIMNIQETTHKFQVSASGMNGLRVEGATVFEVPAATTKMVPITLRVERGSVTPGSHPIDFHVHAVENEQISARERSVFLIR